MHFEKFWRDLVSPQGNFGRIQFLMGETYRIILLAICYLFYWLDLEVLALLLFPFALWVGVVATIKRFNDLGLDSIWILVSLIVIGAGIGLAWQLHSWPWLFIGLGPYLLWVLLTPGKSCAAKPGTQNNQEGNRSA
ncbi:MAG: hypothetical protein L0H37_09740 [Nitrosospira sp.]|nr:hypothetical protein [Nitrosospira sp.]